MSILIIVCFIPGIVIHHHIAYRIPTKGLPTSLYPRRQDQEPARLPIKRNVPPQQPYHHPLLFQPLVSGCRN